MGTAERFGLGALFVLCALIVLVGLLGGEERAAQAAETAPAVAEEDLGTAVLDDTLSPQAMQPAVGGGREAAAGLLAEPGAAGRRAAARSEARPRTLLELTPVAPAPQALRASAPERPVKKPAAPAPAPSERTGRQSAARVYEVRKGDSLERIARRFYRGRGWKLHRVVDFLARANRLGDKNLIFPGMKLKLPPLPKAR